MSTDPTSPSPVRATSRMGQQPLPTDKLLKGWWESLVSKVPAMQAWSLSSDPQRLHWRLKVCWHVPVSPVLGRKTQEGLGVCWSSESICFIFSKKPCHKNKKVIGKHLTLTSDFRTGAHTFREVHLPKEDSMWKGGRYNQMGAEAAGFYSVHCSDPPLEKWETIQPERSSRKAWGGFTFSAGLSPGRLQWPFYTQLPSHQDHYWHLMETTTQCWWSGLLFSIKKNSKK